MGSGFRGILGVLGHFRALGLGLGFWVLGVYGLGPRVTFC